MPKGVYRKVMTEARKAGIRKMNAANPHDPEIALRATNIKTARAILKAMPERIFAGCEFTACQKRVLIVVDAEPVKREVITEDGTMECYWEQRFRQKGVVRIFGMEHHFPENVRIVWKYEPTESNRMEAPIFETVLQDNIPAPTDKQPPMPGR